MKNHLINGTGNAWAWQSNAKLSFTRWTNILPFEAEENAGGFAPTGSI